MVITSIAHGGLWNIHGVANIEKKRIRFLSSVRIFRPRESRVSPRETEMKKKMERLGGEFPWQCKISDPSILESTPLPSPLEMRTMKLFDGSSVVAG